MANYYVSSVAWTAIAQWAALTAYSLGQYRRELAAPTAGNERVFKVTTAGTSGAAEPTWNKNDNATTNDGSVVWTQICGHEAEQAAGNWKAPAARIGSLAVVGLTAADRIFVSSDHDEQWTTDPAYNEAACCLSVSRVGATLPPTSADLSAGAKIEWTGNAGTLTMGFQAYVYGITFEVNGGANTANLQIRSRAGDSVFDNCKFNLTGSGASSRILLGVAETNGPFHIRFKNPVFKFGSTSQMISLNGNDDMFWEGGASAPIDAGGSMPDRLFASAQGLANRMEISKVDFSGFSGTNFFTGGSSHINSRGLFLIDCKVPAAIFSVTYTQPLTDCEIIRYWNCDDGNRTYRYFDLQRYGQMASVDNGARVGGASDGTNSLAWLFTCAITNATWQAPYRSAPIANRITSTGSAKTATLHICSTHALTDANTWFELSTLDDSGDTIGKKHSTQSADFLVAGAGLTTTTEDWTANASARQNSHAYVIGDTYKAASNPGRLFICTTAGTSNGTEPAAVATAVDGTSFADGGATFVAARRYSMSITWTPGRAGVIRGHAAFVPVNTTQRVYVDPYMVIV